MPASVIGRATNNVAEYRALIFGIERAAALGATDLDLVGDSELIVKQVRGEYKVKDPNMKPLHAAVKAALADFESWSIRHVKRDLQRRGRSARQRVPRRRLTHGASQRSAGSPGLYCRDRAAVAQLARASACHAEGRGFESHQPLPIAEPIGHLARFRLWPESGMLGRTACRSHEWGQADFLRAGGPKPAAACILCPGCAVSLPCRVDSYKHLFPGTGAETEKGKLSSGPS